MAITKIVTDSSCDVPAGVARQIGIAVLPLHIRVGNEDFLDGVGLSPDRVCRELTHGKQLPKTSAPSPGEFVTVYDGLAAESDQIVSIHLSPGYSATCDVARLATRYVEGKCHVEVVDSNSVSIGLGLIVLAAARAAQEGKGLSHVLDITREAIAGTRMFGKVDNFAHLFRGRRFRLTKAAVVLGKTGAALGVKVLGEVYGESRVRSPVLAFGRTMALKGLRRWAAKVSDIREIGIAYSTQADEAERLAGYLGRLLPREHILITRLGCVTSTYVGPGTLVMAVM